MERGIIILANSIRPGGRCVAGICPDTGEWIRPVPNNPSRAIPNIPSISRINLLDIVEIPFTGDQPDPPDPYQRENWFVDSWDWDVISRCAVEDALALAENSDLVLHTYGDHIEPSYLNSLPSSKWKSLQFIKANVEFVQDSWDRNRWCAHFKDNQDNMHSMKITDTDFCTKLTRGEEVSQKCLLTVSLAGPWAPPDGSQPKRCYKLVAGVIEL